MTDNGLSPHSKTLLSIALEQARNGTLEIGGLDNLFDFHKREFGDATMTGPDGEGGDTSGGGTGGDGGGDPAGSGDDDDPSGADDRDPKAKIAALESEKDRHFKQRQKAEKDLADTQARLKELEERDLGEQEKVVKERDELKTENEVLSTGLQELRIENSFLTDNTYTWHNPARALKLVDLSEVAIKEDGSVEGLKAALDKLAKSDPYLIKTQDSTDDGKKLPPGGDPQNRGKQKKGETPDRERLLQKYPGLRR